MKFEVSYKKMIVILVPTVLLLSLIFFVHNNIKTLTSLEKLNNYPFYKMTYYGDYGFDDFIKKGVENDRDFFKYLKKRSSLYSQSDIGSFFRIACTGFSAENESGKIIFGNNEDTEKAPVLLLYTYPQNGYASVSMVNLRYIWEDEENNFFNFIKNRINLLAAPYIPMNGMNEQGVAITALSVPEADAGVDDSKITVNTTTIMRLVLDHAKSLDEAVALIKKFNLYFSKSIPVHYFITDSTGKSVIVEFINKKVVINNNNKKWQVVTNFIVDGLSDEDCKATCDRYGTASEVLAAGEGQITESDAMDILKKTSVERTIYSCVFNLSTREVSIVTGKAYDQKMKFSLKNKK